MNANLERYHRQMLLPAIGEDGQQTLSQSSALILGCGALGTHLADALARAGVGRLVIVDRDFVELTNLQRQILFDESDVEVGMPKAEAARRKLAAINSAVDVQAVIDDVNHANIERLAGVGSDLQVDIIVDGLDNFETRYLANDVAVKYGIPYVYGGAVGMTGASFVIMPHTQQGDTPWEKQNLATPCLRCLFDEAPPPGVTPTCDTAGVLGPVVAMIANYQAAEAIKLLVGKFETVARSMLNLDLGSNMIRQFDIASAYAADQCTCCGKHDYEHLKGAHAGGITRLCGRNAIQLSPREGGAASIIFADIASRLGSSNDVTHNAFLLRATLPEEGGKYEITLFKDGRAIVKGTQDTSVARTLYARYVGS